MKILQFIFLLCSFSGWAQLPYFESAFYAEEKFILFSRTDKKLQVQELNGKILSTHSLEKPDLKTQSDPNPVQVFPTLHTFVYQHGPSLWCYDYLTSTERLLWTDPYYSPSSNSVIEGAVFDADLQNGYVFTGGFTAVNVASGKEDVVYADGRLVRKTGETEYLIVQPMKSNFPGTVYALNKLDGPTGKETGQLAKLGHYLGQVNNYVFFTESQSSQTEIIDLKTGDRKKVEGNWYPHSASLLNPARAICTGHKEIATIDLITGVSKNIPLPVPEEEFSASLLCVNPDESALYYYNPANGGFLTLTNASAKWLPLEQSNRVTRKTPVLQCKFQGTLKGTFDLQGRPFMNSEEGSYLIPHNAQWSVSYLNVHWTDLTGDGNNDMLIQSDTYEWKDATIDILISDGKGGFSGYHRINAHGTLHVFEGGFRVHKHEGDDYSGTKVIFNPDNQSIELYEITGGGSYSSETMKTLDPHCERCIGTKDTLFTYLGLYKARNSDIFGHIQINGKSATRVEAFWKKYREADFDNDGVADDAYDTNNDSLLVISGSTGKVRFALRGKPSNAVAADFTGDGYTDFAVTYSNLNLISIYAGGPSIASMKETVCTLDFNPGQCIAVDLDLNGKAEIVGRNSEYMHRIHLNPSGGLDRVETLDQLRLSEYRYAAFNFLNRDPYPDYVALSLFDTKANALSVTPYLGSFNGVNYQLAGSKKKWADFETAYQEFMKEYAAWEERERQRQAEERESNRPSCTKCGGHGAIPDGTEMHTCRSCDGRGRFTDSHSGYSSRYETSGGRESLVTRMYNSYSSSTCSSCGGMGFIDVQGYSTCDRCDGSGDEPE